MGTLRKRFRVAWADGEPIEVTTSARDMIDAADVGGSPAMAVFSTLHAALTRTGHELPPLDEWIDLLDDVDELSTVVADVPGPPTNAVPSAGGPLPYPLSAAPIGVPGLTDQTTVPSQPPKLS